MPRGVLGRFKLPILNEFPSIVSTEDMRQLENLQVARKPTKIPIYEELADRYCHPFFFGQLGCLFSGLDARALSIRWWRQCQDSLRDLNLDEPLLNRVIEYAMKKLATDSMVAFKESQTINYYQSWRTTSAHPFPSTLKEPSQLLVLKQCWQALGEPERMRYMRRLAIETVQLEGVFCLTESAMQDVVNRGISDACAVPTPRSHIQCETTIKAILCDTLEAYQYLSNNMLRQDCLTRSQMCVLHSILMRTCRFGEHTYITPGETRTTTGATVIVGGRRPIEFCPYHLVDTELDVICNLTKARLLDIQDPLALASWIHLILVRCHPFDDGNGRISRIIASIPLLMLGLPPVAVLQTRAATYYDAINMAYDGNFDSLAQHMLDCMKLILTDGQIQSSNVLLDIL